MNFFHPPSSSPFLLFSFFIFPPPPPLFFLSLLSHSYFFFLLLFLRRCARGGKSGTRWYFHSLIISHLCFFMIIHFPFFYFIFLSTFYSLPHLPYSYLLPSPLLLSSLSSLYSLCFLASSLSPFFLSLPLFFHCLFFRISITPAFSQNFFFTTFCKIIL